MRPMLRGFALDAGVEVVRPVESWDDLVDVFGFEGGDQGARRPDSGEQICWGVIGDESPWCVGQGKSGGCDFGGELGGVAARRCGSVAVELENGFSGGAGAA